jgi:hypothetical protein
VTFAGQVLPAGMSAAPLTNTHGETAKGLPTAFPSPWVAPALQATQEALVATRVATDGGDWGQLIGVRRDRPADPGLYRTSFI